MAFIPVECVVADLFVFFSQEYSLPTTGTKMMLEARHRQWILLFNSNLDSLHPSKESVSTRFSYFFGRLLAD